MRSVVDLGMVVSCLALSSALVAASAIAPDERSDGARPGSHAPEPTSADTAVALGDPAPSSPPVEVELVERTSLVRVAAPADGGEAGVDRPGVFDRGPTPEAGAASRAERDSSGATDGRQDTSDPMEPADDTGSAAADTDAAADGGAGQDEDPDADDADDPAEADAARDIDEPADDGGSAPGGDEPAPEDEEPAGAGDDPVYVTADGTRVDAERIRTFLDGRGAPLADQAEEFVRAARTHDVDPRVVVGIAVAESSGGEALPPGSHNAWGWGGSGPQGLAAWSSWPEAIDAYTGRLGELYDTDDVDESFARTYCPPNWRWWLDTVTWVIDQI